MKCQCVEVDERGMNARPLLKTGEFAVELASATTVAEFNGEEAALAAGERAANRRPHSKLIVYPGAGKPVGRGRHQLEHPGARV